MKQEFQDAIRILQGQFAGLEADNSRLREENARLREENAKLKVAGDPTNSNQDKNEAARLYIANLVGGVNPPPRRGYNLGHRWSQCTFQVRYSQVQEGNRWHWKRVFGPEGSVEYDQLILVGENKKTGAAASASGGGIHLYILFSVPKLEVRRLTNSQGDVTLNVNPDTAKTPEAKLLYGKYQVTADELRRYDRSVRES